MVHATLICETESQKRILVGKGGEVVRRIGTGMHVPLVEESAGRPGATSSCASKVRPQLAAR